MAAADGSKKTPRVKKASVDKTASRGSGRGFNKKVDPSKFSSVGSYDSLEDGKLTRGGKSGHMIGIAKQAGAFKDGGLGMADIADSENIGYYSFEFPVDTLELPQSRKEEIRFYRIAYDRDPIVGRAIDLHTELPMSKLLLDKPACSIESFADFIYDDYQRLVNDSALMTTLLDATREYWMVGEAYLFVEQEGDIPLCPEAEKLQKKGLKGRGQVSETQNGPKGLDELTILEWLAPEIRKTSVREAKKIGLDLKTKTADIDKDIRSKIASLKTRVKIAAMKLADEPTETATPAKGVEGGDPVLEEAPTPSADTPAPGPNDLPSDEEVSTLDPEDQAEVDEMKKTIELLERKKVLLKELKEIRDLKEKEYELFSHVTNPEFEGWDTIRLIPPERIEILRDGKGFQGNPSYMYAPSPEQKEYYLESDDIQQEVKDELEDTGKIRLNQDPLKGSFLIHFARKKAPFEDHGRSILQRCLKTIIYRDKLRQVQNTLASRNMTPKTVVSAPEVPVQELMTLRAHIDDAKSDPDYTIVVNYDLTWNEIGAEGRLLALDGEWQHTTNDLAVGMGFTPDLLSGEGLFSNTRIHLEMMNTTYLLFRETLAHITGEFLFKPVAMKKGYFELDNYGRPRWIYPKLSFNRLALRDTGDVYEMFVTMYTKGSLPVEYIYDLLNIDPSAAKRTLEQDLFTVNDSKFNEVLTSVYAALADKLFDGTDILERIRKGLGLHKEEKKDGLEGTGEGM